MNYREIMSKLHRLEIGKVEKIVNFATNPNSEWRYKNCPLEQTRSSSTFHYIETMCYFDSELYSQPYSNIQKPPKSTPATLIWTKPKFLHVKHSNNFKIWKNHTSHLRKNRSYQPWENFEPYFQPYNNI